MKNQVKAIAMAFSVALLLFSCSPDQVVPKTDGKSNELENGIMGDSGPHYTLFPICSPVESLPLSSPMGGFNIPSTSTPWGSMQIFNGLDNTGKNVLERSINVAYNWYVSEVSSFVGNASLLQIGPNGIPLIDSTWTVEGINPAMNSVSLHTDLASLPSNNILITKITIGQMDWVAFDGSLDASTLTELWVWNSQYLVVGSGREAPSPLFMPWTTASCAALADDNSAAQF